MVTAESITSNDPTETKTMHQASELEPSEPPKYWEMEFRPLGNESSPFCRTEWFHIHLKIAFSHLSVWLIGQGGWKLRRRPGFDS